MMLSELELVSAVAHSEPPPLEVEPASELCAVDPEELISHIVCASSMWLWLLLTPLEFDTFFTFKIY